MAKVTAAREQDWWTVHDLQRGHEVRCSSAKVFLAYLLSPGTRPTSRLIYRNPEEGTAAFLIYGPRADDFEFLTLRYTLTAREVEAFDQAERRSFLGRCVELWGPFSLPPVREALKL